MRSRVEHRVCDARRDWLRREHAVATESHIAREALAPRLLDEDEGSQRADRQRRHEVPHIVLADEARCGQSQTGQSELVAVDLRELELVPREAPDDEEVQQTYSTRLNLPEQSFENSRAEVVFVEMNDDELDIAEGVLRHVDHLAPGQPSARALMAANSSAVIVPSERSFAALSISSLGLDPTTLRMYESAAFRWSR